jgi:cysteine protease ATG4
VWNWLGGEFVGKMSQFAHGISSLDTSSASTLDTPIWMLGRQFVNAEVDLDEYKQAFESILWFTYRRDYAKMEPYEYTSDAGWGCMLRSAQMMLSQALKRRLLGRDWRAPLFSTEKLPQEYVTLLKWFVDSPEPECIYSIHNMVKLGMRYDKLPGEWYGPTTAAQVLRDLVNLHSRELGGVLSMYVPQEGVVYSDDVMRLCVSHLDDDDLDAAADGGPSAKVEAEPSRDPQAFYDPLLNPPKNTSEREWKTSLLVLIPLRLGLDQLNESYVPAIQKTFTFPQSVGIIGGKKGHSVYFVGSQESQLHLLDPHDVHPTAELNASFPTATHLRTVHSSRPLVMSVQSIDPSLALGFLCETRADYLDFCQRVSNLQEEFAGMCPFSVASRRPDYAANEAMEMLADCMSGDSMNEENASDDEDEYVLI